MEFLNDSEVMGLLREHGITSTADENDRVFLRMKQTAETVRVFMTGGAVEPDPADDITEVIKVAPEALADAIEGILHRMHLSEILLVPIGKWRSIFDAVAFSLADNEDWQAVDAAATVELNTRDPLLCGPADFHTIGALLGALLSDGETADQGLMVTSPGAPILIEINPAGAASLCFGTQVLADEATDAIRG